MNSSISSIPRLGETKTKPKVGEVRLTTDGKRRKVFDGKCWQYLCIGDPNCRIQSKGACRHHRNFLNDCKSNESNSIEISLNETPPTNTIQRPKPGDTQLLANGNRRVWRGARWHSLCRAENCIVQARDFCKTHQNQRMSLPNSNQNISQGPRLMARTRSCTINGETEKEEHQETEPQQETSSTVEDKISPQLPANKRRRLDDNINDAIAVSPLEKRELHTRNGRRVRCNGLIWKHLCADKKNGFYKRKYQRHSMPVKKIDQIIKANQNNGNKIASLSSDIIDSSVPTNPIPQVKNSKKRKTMGDMIHGEQFLPKRKANGKRRKGSNKSITLHLEPNVSSASVFDIINLKEKSIEEPVLNDVDVSPSFKPNRLNTNYHSTEIPVQSPLPFIYDSSPSAILEQFGTIIKKEAVIEDETLICIPAMNTNGIDSPCQTLQDFLREEEMKKKEFKLDCQRISYRLAKIQDCIGSISSMTS